jgi:hypothetical protein
VKCAERSVEHVEVGWNHQWADYCLENSQEAACSAMTRSNWLKPVCCSTSLQPIESWDVWDGTAWHPLIWLLGLKLINDPLIPRSFSRSMVHNFDHLWFSQHDPGWSKKRIFNYGNYGLWLYTGSIPTYAGLISHACTHESFTSAAPTLPDATPSTWNSWLQIHLQFCLLVPRVRPCWKLRLWRGYLLITHSR